MPSPKIDPHSEAMIFRALHEPQNRDLDPYPYDGDEEQRKAWLEESLKSNTASLEHDKRIRSILQAMINLLEV